MIPLSTRWIKESNSKIERLDHEEEGWVELELRWNGRLPDIMTLGNSWKTRHHWGTCIIKFTIDRCQRIVLWDLMQNAIVRPYRVENHAKCGWLIVKQNWVLVLSCFEPWHFEQDDQNKKLMHRPWTILADTNQVSGEEEQLSRMRRIQLWRMNWDKLDVLPRSLPQRSGPQKGAHHRTEHWQSTLNLQSIHQKFIQY